eukprot:3746822-Pleurochrysis_carterae.AAC.1
MNYYALLKRRATMRKGELKEIIVREGKWRTAPMTSNEDQNGNNDRNNNSASNRNNATSNRNNNNQGNASNRNNNNQGNNKNGNNTASISPSALVAPLPRGIESGNNTLMKHSLL